MRKIIFLISCMIMSGIMFQSCSPNDSTIQQNVREELAKNFTEDEVTPTVLQGVVTLTGSVTSQEKKDIAERDAESVKGVKSVVNYLNIIQNETITQDSFVHSDETIQSTIETKLRSQSFNDVKVEVSNGEVTLKGNLKRNDLIKVMQIANESNVTKVTNDITLN